MSLNIPVRRDPNNPPPMLACERCGTHWPWIWRPASESDMPLNRSLGALWAAPKVNPCLGCQEDATRLLRANVDERAVHALLPYVPFVLHPKRLVHQGPSESELAFQRRVRDLNHSGDVAVIGVLACNKAAVLRLTELVHRRRLRRNVVIHGPPGTGKSLLASALGRRLLNADTRLKRWYLNEDGRPVEEAPDVSWDTRRPTALTRQRPQAVLYKRLDALMEEQADRFRNRATPVRNASSFKGVLLFDELGISDSPNRIEIDTVNHVLGKRADRQLRTVAITNLDPEVFGERYGARVGSRLREYDIIPIVGADWRL